MKWKRLERKVRPEGTDVIYGLEDSDITVESRKRHVPHANGEGTWDYTSYHVVVNGKDLTTRYSLKDAKALAELLYKGEEETEVRKIRVVLKRPDSKPYVTYISNSLKNLQNTVDGYIEAVTVSEDVVILCNEEGRLKGLDFNCTVAGVGFVGTIIFVGYKGEEFTDLPMDFGDFKKVFSELFE